MKKEKIVRVLDNVKFVFGSLTLFYMWLASCLFLVKSSSIQAGNWCFYSGLVFAGMMLLTSPNMKAWILKKPKSSTGNKGV